MTAKIEVNIAANVSGGADVSKMEQNLGQLGAAGTEAGKGATNAATGLNQTDAAATKASGGLNKTGQSLENVEAHLVETQRKLAAVRDQLIAGFSFKEFVSAAADMEKLHAGLTAITGDTKAASAEMEFVTRVANRAGIEVTAAGSAYLGLAAATKGTAVEGEPTRRVFEAVATSMAKAGKTSAETQNALVALAQMASKGTVAMEELRGQLGEALPGALQAAASGMGITTKDLITLVENGKVAAEDLFPALTKGLTDLYGTAPQAQTLSQEITGIKNAFVTMTGAIGDAGALDMLKLGAEGAQTAIVLFGDSMIQIGQILGTFIAALTHMDFSGFDAAMLEIETSARTRLLKAAEHNTVLTSALKLSSDQSIQTAIYVKEMGDTTAKAGQQANDAAPSYVALGNQYGKNLEVIKELIAVTEKEVDAVKARGVAAVEAAKLTNDEQRVREAMAKAVRDESEAMTSLSERKQAELDILKMELQAKRDWLAAQSGPISDARKKELEDTEKSIALKQQEVDKTNAQAAALQAKAKANSEEAIAAETARKSIQATLTTRTAEVRAALDVAQGQREIANSTLRIAELSGNDETIRRAKIAAIEAEIAVTKAKVAVMKAEAQGSIDVSKAEMEELRIKGELTKQKQAELDASIKVAEAKIKLADATGQSTAASDALIRSLRNGSTALNGHRDAASGAAGAHGSLAQSINLASDAVERLNMKYMQSSKYSEHQIELLGREAAAQQRLNDVKQQAIDLENKRRGVDREGFSVGANGQRINESVATPQEIEKRLLDGGPPAAVARSQAEAIARAVNDEAKGAYSTLGGFSGGEGSKSLEQRIQEALRNTRGLASVPGAGSTQAAAASVHGGAAKTYDVQLGSSTAKFGSDAEAQAFIAELKKAKLAS